MGDLRARSKEYTGTSDGEHDDYAPVSAPAVVLHCKSALGGLL